MKSENVDKYENVVIRKEQEVGINNFGLDYLVGLEDEIERLKDLVKQLWNNNKSSNLNEEQKELLNSTIFGSDKE